MHDHQKHQKAILYMMFLLTYIYIYIYIYIFWGGAQKQHKTTWFMFMILTTTTTTTADLSRTGPDLILDLIRIGSDPDLARFDPGRAAWWI